MANWAQGKYKVQNTNKYIGKNLPKYRSGWELSFMMFCDNHDSVLNWASESIQIPYRNPFTGKPTVYIPDFFVLYQDKNGIQRAEIVEIKPKKQSLIESRVTSARDKAAVALNHAKWAAAKAYAKKIGVNFRVITEDDLFYKGRRK
jgi:hypothetical protein